MKVDKIRNKTSIIQKIEIKKFRSFDQVIIEAGNLNIYSGKNNSGKSNILKALNLFFNQKSNYDTPFSHQDDFNKAFGGAAGGRRAIEITIHFWPCGNGALKDSFCVRRTFTADSPIYDQKIYSDNQTIQEKLDKNDGNIVRQFTRFLNNLEYIYIPAVRDKKFINTLLLRFEAIIRNDVSGKDFDGKINELSDILSKKSNGISKDFEKFIGLPAHASLSSNTQDVLGAISIDILSGIQIKNKKAKKDGGGKIINLSVNLFSSGDGIVMSYLVFFLAFLTRKTNKRYIWGFEEPENSLEYAKVQQLAHDFYNNFSHTAQIFITTHSPAFIELKDLPGVEFYRVYIPPQREEDKKAGYPDRQASRVQKLETLYQLTLFPSGTDEKLLKTLDEELHLVEQASEIQKAVDMLIKEKQEYVKNNKNIEKLNAKIMKMCPSKIFICEDEKAKPLWSTLFKKYNIENVSIMTSCGVYNDKIEKWIEQQSYINKDFSPIVWREVDRDGFTYEQQRAIEKKFKSKCHSCKKYKYSMLPVNEIENFLLINNNVVSDNDFESFQDSVKDSFISTATNNLNVCNKYILSDQSLFPFGTSREHILMAQKMRDQALQDWRKYMPGKDILRLKGNIDVQKSFKEMTVERIPEDLKKYLDDIKDFFDE